MLRLPFLMILAVMAALALPVQAQDLPADTSGTGAMDLPADTSGTGAMALPADTSDAVAAQVPLTLPPLRAPDSTGLPVQSAAFDITDLLMEQGDWVHDFGSFGWPDGWAPRGLDPGGQGLTLEGVPYGDPATGRALYELYPMAYSGPVGVAQGTYGRAYSVDGTLPESMPARPLTVLRYYSSSTGLQAVGATHSQLRTRRFLGKPARFMFVGGYSGAGATGEYPGSQLKRRRQLFARVHLQLPKLELEIVELTGRYRIGAQGGVQPFSGFTYESIYERLGAEVDEESAFRQVVRNDLWISASRPLAGDTLALTAFRTRHRDAFTYSGDTLGVTAARTGLLGSMGIPGTDGAVRAHAAFWETTFPEADSLTPSAAEHTAIVGLETRARLPFGRLTAALDLHVHRGQSMFVGRARQELPWGFAASFSRSRATASPVDRYGFGQTFTGIGDQEDGSISMTTFSWEGAFRAISFTMEAFAVKRRRVVERMLDSSADMVSVWFASQADYSGARLRLGLRDRSTRGLYGWIGAETLSDFRALGGISERPDELRTHEIEDRLSRSRPNKTVHLRWGARMLLFKGDLDLDVYLRARAWPEHLGRRLHTATGLLAVPDEGARTLPASAILDVVAEAGIRTATLFVSVENVLSGTTLILGNQLVPDYPYPESRLRFGVYWPIFD